MMHLDRLSVKYNSRLVGVLSLVPGSNLCAFEYDKLWIADGFSLSPLELPLKEGVFIAKPQPFAGNFGVFEDSLPDGYGRYLLHKALLKVGIDDMQMTALDRLSIIGNGGMGALTYEPITELLPKEDVTDFDALQKKALEVLSERSDKDAELLLFNSMNSGGCRPKAIFSDSDGHWLIKFRHTYDPKDMGLQEYHYNEVARKCGINVPEFKLTNGKYFTVRRFDLAPNGERIHTVTAGGLLCLSLDNPILDYKNLLALTGYLTQDTRDVAEMFRRMVFNYLMDNKDDHCKNFSFQVMRDERGRWGWRLAPAYDLTLCVEGYHGEHATSVNGSSAPSLSDMLAIGLKFKMSEAECRAIINEVMAGCGDILRLQLR